MAVLKVNRQDTRDMALREVDRLIRAAGRPLSMEVDARPLDVQQAEIQEKIDAAREAAAITQQKQQQQDDRERQGCGGARSAARGGALCECTLCKCCTTD
jgi:hypothetical protein